MAISASHGLLDPSLQGIHVPYQWIYAAETNRINATGFISTDVGKLAIQTDDNSLWILTDVTPTWLAVGSAAATSADPQECILKQKLNYDDDLNFLIYLQDDFRSDFE
jgi:hypothetical protein